MSYICICLLVSVGLCVLIKRTVLGILFVICYLYLGREGFAALISRCIGRVCRTCS